MSRVRTNRAWKRAISLITVLVLLISAMPVSLAAGNNSAQTGAIRQTAGGNVIAAENESELTVSPEPPVETPEPTPEPDESSEPSATPEETVSPEPSLSPSPSPLPYGFVGMPEGYVLSADELEAKEDMNDLRILSSTESLAQGEDYVADQVVFWAETREYAEMVAAAYSGELLQYSDYIAVVELKTATVVQALSVAADQDTIMPALDPNHIICLDPGEKDKTPEVDLDFRTKALAPRLQTWYDRPNDPFLQDPDSYDYQWMHDVVNTYEAWGVTTGDASVKVAVIDSGVRTTHEDLSGKVTVISMTDWTGRTNDDTDGHGTHVAGIIAAKSGNGKGGAGIAPGVSILSLAALPGGEGNDAWIASAITRATDGGAKIINMSLGGYYYNSTVDAAVQYAVGRNVTVIAAMGNNGSNSMVYPAGYDNVIAVSAVDPGLRRVYFSNYGGWADLAAPGVDILSTVIDSNASYELKGGTSMATPVVSGVAALYMSKAGWVSPSAMEKKLKACVTKSSSSSIGAGVIDAAKLFSTDKAAPVITIKTSSGTVLTSFVSPIPQETTMTIAEAAGATNAKMILYTTDGTTPSVVNGEVKNGIIYSSGFSLSTLPTGKAITVKAMCISGMGISSAVATLKFTISPSSLVTGVSISGVSKITAGGSTTFTASVSATANVPQNVTWQILSRSGAVKAALSSTGVLKTVANDGGTVTIRALSNVNSTKYADLTVTIEAIPFISLIKLDQSKLVLGVRSGYPSSAQISIHSVTNAKGEAVSPETILRKWSSSNTKVALVDDNGLVSAVGKGSATIKCMALDGSGKYASCAVVVNQLSESVTIAGQKSIPSGKTATYKATVMPSNVSTAVVVYSLSGAPDGVTISSTKGIVSVPAAVTSGSFAVVATAIDGTGLSGSIDVEIAPLCASIALSSEDTRSTITRTSLGVTTGASMFPLNIASTSFDDSVLQLGYSIIGNSTQPVWTSSSSSVASVDQTGRVTALKAGSTTITCAAQDGSGRKAAMKISVLNPVQSITLAGQKSIPMGKTAAFQATVLPSTASVKSVEWSLVDAPVGVSISTKGVVSVPSTVLSGSFTIRATAADGSEIFSSHAVTIAAASTSLLLTSADSRANLTRTSTGVITGAIMYPLNITTTTENDTQLQLGYSIIGNSTQPVWTSSSPSVASVDQTGKVTALKAGSTTITCATQDGSGRKAAMKITVYVPTAGITVNTSAPLMDYDTPTIAFGKSASNYVTYWDTYGAPTLKKVAWDFLVLEETFDGDFVEDWTDYFKASKRVTVDSSGTLKVSSNMFYDWMSIPYSFSIYVIARAADGSGTMGYLEYTVQPATTYVIPKSTTLYLSARSSNNTIQFYASSYFTDFTVTSSNPKVAGYADYLIQTYDSYRDELVFKANIYTGLPGTATITIKANDGSGKYCTVNVIVYEPITSP